MEVPSGGPAIRLPRALAGHVRDVLAGRLPPAVPRDAATVMLLRSEPLAEPPPPAAGHAAAPAARPEPGIEVYMLRRKSSMAFAPGAFVFPGGSVDARDADEDVAWAGPDAAAWGRVFDAARRSGLGAGLRRGQGDLRGVRRAAGRAVGRDRGGRHQRRRLGGRPERAARPVGLARRAARPASPRASRRPAQALVAVDHAGRREAPLRRQVLRRRAAPRTADQGRRRRGRAGRLGQAGRRDRGRAEQGDRALAAHRGDPRRACLVRHRGRRARRAAAGQAAAAGDHADRGHALAHRPRTSRSTRCDRAGLRREHRGRTSTGQGRRGPAACSRPTRR